MDNKDVRIICSHGLAFISLIMLIFKEKELAIFNLCMAIWVKQ